MQSFKEQKHKISIEKKDKRLADLEQEKKFLTAAKQLQNEEKDIKRKKRLELVSEEQRKKAEEVSQKLEQKKERTQNQLQANKIKFESNLEYKRSIANDAQEKIRAKNQQDQERLDTIERKATQKMRKA